MDITKIVTMLDYLIRKLNDLLNKLLGSSGKETLTSNTVEFSTSKDILWTTTPSE